MSESNYVECEECAFRKDNPHGFAIWYCNHHKQVLRNDHTKMIYIMGCKKGKRK